MSAQSTGLSKDEKKVRRRYRAHERSSLDQLLFTRQQARRLLGNVSVATLQRLEAQGILRPKRLDPSKAGIGQVFYTRANLLELVGDDDE
jgi:hypothetical protein